jgi:hypothetical protein
MTRILVITAVAGLGAFTALLVRGCGGCSAARRDAPADTSPRVHGSAEPSPVTPASPMVHRLPGKSAEEPGRDPDIIASADPASSSYDPVTVNRTTDISPRELLRKEPRVSSFADRREQALRNRLTERLRRRVPFATKLDVTCYTSSCELTLESGQASEDLNTALQSMELEQLSDTEMVGPRDDVSGHRQGGISIVLLYSPTQRDHATYDELLRRHQERDGLPKNPQ